LTGFSKVGEKLQQKAISIAPKLDIDTKKLNPSKTSTVKKEMSNAIVTDTRNKDKVILVALEEIKKRECWGWPHLIAYPDWHWYTIGCWTKSYRGEKISEEVAYDRLQSVVNGMYDKLSGRYSRMTNNQLSATISLWFNCHSCLAGVKQGISDKTWYSWSYWRLPWWKRVYMEWLHKRRVSEKNLYNK